MNPSPKKRGRPTKPEAEKAVLLIVTVKPEHMRRVREVMENRGLDRSKAVQWLIERAEG
jgi:hypothetical protein